MRKTGVFVLAALGGLLCCVRPVLANDVSVSIGSEHWASGTKITTGAYNTAVSGQPAPFNTFCGSDTASNCSASWTFTYSLPAGSIAAATLTLGIYDIDSAATGNQVGSFTLDGTDDLTSALNTVSEGLHIPNSYYEVLTISIPTSDFTDLSSGTANFSLTLSGPGLGVLLPTTYNGAGLDFSTLDMTVVPEPSTFMLWGTGLLLLGTTRLLRKFVPNNKASGLAG
jgi:hypothetical protein